MKPDSRLDAPEATMSSPRATASTPVAFVVLCFFSPAWARAWIAQLISPTTPLEWIDLVHEYFERVHGIAWLAFGPLVVIALGGIALYLWNERRRWPPRVRFQMFQGHNQNSNAKGTTGPTATAERDGEGDAGTPIISTQALTNMLISEIVSRGSGRSLERVVDRPAGAPLDISVALGDRWRWLAAFPDWFSARRVLTVRVEAEITGDREVTVLLGIVDDHGHVKDSGTVTERSPKTPYPEVWALTMRSAAAWVRWQLVEHKAESDSSCFGTSDWRSWASFRKGVWFHQHEKLIEARHKYLEAIVADHDNAAAWSNLASLDVRKASGWDRALERLDIVESLVEDEAKQQKSRRHCRGRWTNLVWYRARNLRALTLLHRATGTKDRGDLVAARDAALELVQGLAHAHLALVTTPPEGTDTFDGMSRGEKDDLRELVLNTEDAAIARLASALVELNAGSKPMLEPTTEPSTSSASVGPGHPDVRSSMQRLRDLKPESATADDVLDILYGLHCRGGLPCSAEYNLACLYARAYAKRVDDSSLAHEALRHLERALEGHVTDYEWIRNQDPALESLRVGKHEHRFEELLSNLEGRPCETVSHLS